MPKRFFNPIIGIVGTDSVRIYRENKALAGERIANGVDYWESCPHFLRARASKSDGGGRWIVKLSKSGCLRRIVQVAAGSSARGYGSLCSADARVKRETDKQNQLNVMAEYLRGCPAMGRM